MKLFGIELFKFKRDVEIKSMYDFARFGWAENYFTDDGVMTTNEAYREALVEDKKKKKKVDQPINVSLTARGLFKLGALNDNKFYIRAEEDYLKAQIAEAQDKLDFLPKIKKRKNERGFELEGFMNAGVKHSREELESIVERLNNRREIKKFNHLVKKYPYTRSQKIGEILKANQNLRCKSADDFVPDFPKVAISAMKEYQAMCVDLCGKNTNFYVIATKEDFGEKDRRRDPILLAQSPFGFFWQILGAWDEEMVYLGDL